MISLLVSGLTLTALCDLERAVVLEAADQIETAYVIEAEAQRIASELRMLDASSDVSATCSAEEAFASNLTKDIRQVSGDHHFYVEVTAEQEDNDWIEEWRQSGSVMGQGITHVQVFEGNIGYIRIKSFFELEAAYPFYLAAFDLVADTDALVLDLRDNHGGSPETAWPLQWTFLEPGAVSPIKMESRVEAVTPREEPSVLWARYGTERPVFVLVNKDTFSAPEAVAYTLQATGRATVIGESSGGGAHMLDGGAALSGGFTVYTPTKRPISTITGDNWEGIGVTPNIQTSEADTLNTALKLARSTKTAKQHLRTRD
jgi:C-terminal processing protease CtpA/Prc